MSEPLSQQETVDRGEDAAGVASFSVLRELSETELRNAIGGDAAPSTGHTLSGSPPPPC